MAQILGLRELNRATLARQHLLERSPLDATSMVAHLLGLQAQLPQSWYVGLWSRMSTIDPVEVGDLLESRLLVRIPVMRSTIHLLTAQDALGLRPLMQVPIERSTMGAFGRWIKDLNPDAIAVSARALVSEKPLQAAELGRGLVPNFPGRDPDALAQAARVWLPMVQVPPRGVWGRSGRPLQAPLDTWLGKPMKAFALPDMIRRYLGAFGPASVRDIQQWCGLTKLAPVIEEMRHELATFRDVAGVELFDLDEAPRPSPNTPAPVRFLYDYDNLLLSHHDRSRIVGEPGAVDYETHGYGYDSNMQPSSMLVDGFVGGTWKVLNTRGSAALTVTGFRRFTAAENREINREGLGLLAFLHPKSAPSVEIV